MNLIDEEQIRKLLSFMSQEQLGVMFQRFFEPVSSGKNALIEAIEQHDIETVLKQSHYIKGSSSFLGMKTIYEICNHIGEILNSDAPLDLTAVSVQLENAWINSQQESEAFLKKILPAK